MPIISQAPDELSNCSRSRIAEPLSKIFALVEVIFLLLVFAPATVNKLVFHRGTATYPRQIPFVDQSLDEF
jgi:hypothetical protein